MITHDRQRRIVLRGALATGCALALPALLTGCGNGESPQTSPQSGAEPQQPAPAQSAPSSTGESQGSQAGTKVSKEQAQYQNQPKGEQACENCQQFVAASNTCQVVEGEVSPSGWCALWVKKV